MTATEIVVCVLGMSFLIPVVTHLTVRMGWGGYYRATRDHSDWLATLVNRTERDDDGKA